MSTPLVLIREAIQFRADMATVFGEQMIEDALAGKISKATVQDYGGLTHCLDLAGRAVNFGKAMCAEHGEATVMAFLALSRAEEGL